MFQNISPDSVRSGRTCPANLGVRSCPVRKLICPVRSSPTSNPHDFNLHIDIFSPYLNVSRSIADLYSGFKKLEGLFTYLVKQI